MRAIQQDRYGGPEVLRLTEVPDPEPIPTEVLVRIVAAGVNPIDGKTRSGGGFAPVVGPPPFIPGWDLSGVVAETGYGVTRFRPGDEVYGLAFFPRRAGTYAEYISVPSRQLARKPATVGHVPAAALPLVGLTAWQLVEAADVQPGQRVLIHAAAGGVGHLAVQIAKARGAYVIGTARTERHAFLRELGADETVDYTTIRFEDAVDQVDVVVDLVGGDTRVRSLDVLGRGGLLIPVPRGEPDPTGPAARRGIRVLPIIVEPDHVGLAGLAAMVDAGALRVSVTATRPLAEAADVHRAMEAGGAVGKTVLVVDPALAG
ncbi:NADP-dependent oxidoreductase [Micromonospora zamorensis]|uniref:NADP-dependent oxidoreductase n=1 Tax=Micromonospora zamorensis TaxID=709883 RepID=UPI0008200CC0|nr:NADP-dependent oxidoreductase [Micromonospora zamorensis]SCG36246.1 NADPH:quinone reductase [Micromonospora zamorensis]